MEQVSGLLQDQQMVTGLEGLRELRRDHGHAATAERHRRSRYEARDGGRHWSGHRAISVWKPSRTVVESDHSTERCADGRRARGLSSAPKGSGRRDEHDAGITILGRR